MGYGKGYKGVGMEGYIARWYADNAQKDIQRFEKDAKRVFENVTEGASILEVAPGPGYLSIELAKLGRFTITGLDISSTFVEIAKKKAEEARVKVDFRQGNVADMPFDNETFDFIFCSSAFKNFDQPIDALNEMHRVLRKNGKALITDLRRDADEKAITEHVNNMGLSMINALLTKWTFKHMLIPRAYTKDEFSRMVAQTAFVECSIHGDLIGLEIILEKYR
jgi:ubiquinone/menaquinone biosynthesis C-methylase UbiE